jgi:hypothetical protein
MTDTITIFGRTLTKRSRVHMDDCSHWMMYETRDEGGNLCISAFDRDHSWSVCVTQSFTGGSAVECRVVSATFADLERLWLEHASLHTPLLCALVVDGMDCPKCEGRGDVSYDRDYGTHIAAVEHECPDCEGTGKR